MSAIPNQSVIEKIISENASIKHNGTAFKASEKYQVIDTVSVLKRLMNENFEPVEWTKTINPYNKHKVILKHTSFKEVNKEDLLQPMVHLTNSNNKTKSFSLNIGFLRLACSNGLTTFDSLSHLKRKHIGKHTTQIVEDFLNGFHSYVDDKMDIIRTMDEIHLQSQQINEFAMEALRLKFGNLNPIIEKEGQEIAQKIVERNRIYDREDTLWKVYNTVQENIFNGNFSVNGRKNRGIRSEWVQESMNNRLWNLATEFLKELAV